MARHKSAQWMAAMMALSVGVSFFVAGVIGMTAMSPDQYGEVAVALEIEAMAGVQMTASLLIVFGLLYNGRWRWSAALRFAGAVAVMLLCIGLAWSALQARDGWPFAVYCTCFGIVCIGPVAWWNLVDLRAALQWWPDGRAG